MLVSCRALVVWVLCVIGASVKYGAWKGVKQLSAVVVRLWRRWAEAIWPGEREFSG